ncbi:hypothetical protein ANANG_G00027380 [Anguilla anguilla]|uniref:SRCR domain-containing protein n=1 Tax=Anguilla anguilla TaxID=7936 RepID=A0A9D3MTI6_ANGAN|nr:hypothetical protein ANANG_G00027380 [Anguilla anguilla]
MCVGYTESRLADGPDNCSGRVELQHLGSALSALDGTVRLAGEGACEGQVEVYYQQTWSRVVGSWSFSEASVACRQLGCGSAVQVYSSSPSGTGGSGECLMGVQCSGERGSPGELQHSTQPHLQLQGTGVHRLFQ